MLVPSIANVDLNLLRVFLTVVRCGGFSSAQADLNVSLATISTQISKLEDRLGVPLCQRGRSGFALTEEGKKIHDATQALFAHLENFRTTIESTRGKLGGELNIGVIDNMVTHPSFHLHRALRKFHNEAPEVRISVEVESPNQLEQMVLDGQAHVGIGFFPRRLSHINYQPIFNEQMELFASRQHRLFRISDDNISIDEVAKCSHAQRGYVSLEQTPKLHRSFNFRARAHNIEGLLHLILSGEFLAFLSTHYAEHWVKTGIIRSIKPATFAYTSTHELIRRNTSQETAATSLFMACALEAVDSQFKK